MFRLGFSSLIYIISILAFFVVVVAISLMAARVRKTKARASGQPSALPSIKCQHIRLGSQEYLLFPEGQILTKEGVERQEFPIAQLFENGNIMQLGRVIATKADIEFLGGALVRISNDGRRIEVLYDSPAPTTTPTATSGTCTPYDMARQLQSKFPDNVKIVVKGMPGDKTDLSKYWSEPDDDEPVIEAKFTSDKDPAHLSKMDEYHHLSQAHPEFFKELIASYRSAFGSIIKYVKKNYPAASRTFSRHLIVDSDPGFDAFFRNQVVRYDSGKTTEGPYLGETFISQGFSIALAALKPTMMFASECVRDSEKLASEVPIDAVAAVGELYSSWRLDHYPMIFPSSPEAEFGFQTTHTFILAHETAHFLFRYDESLGNKMQIWAQDALTDVLQNLECSSDHGEVRWSRVLDDEAVLAAWSKEIAADILAYEISGDVLRIGEQYELLGLATVVSIQVIAEKFWRLKGQGLPATHPPALVRLNTILKHLQRLQDKTREDFENSVTWCVPMRIVAAVGQVLLQINGLTFSDGEHWGKK